jgi:hypothetical protein
MMTYQGGSNFLVGATPVTILVRVAKRFALFWRDWLAWL